MVLLVVVCILFKIYLGFVLRVKCNVFYFPFVYKVNLSKILKSSSFEIHELVI